MNTKTNFLASSDAFENSPVVQSPAEESPTLGEVDSEAAGGDNFKTNKSSRWQN